MAEKEAENKLYFWIHEGDVVVHPSKEAVKESYGITKKPDMEMDAEKFYTEYMSFARLEDGKIVLGPPPEDEKRARLNDLYAMVQQAETTLTATDYAVLKIAEGVADADKYTDVLEERKEARKCINELEGEIRALEAELYPVEVPVEGADGLQGEPEGN